jgi:hypothetical protein
MLIYQVIRYSVASMNIQYFKRDNITEKTSVMGRIKITDK